MESRLLLKTLFLEKRTFTFLSKKLRIKLERDKVKYCVFCDIVKNSEKYFLRVQNILRKRIHDVCISCKHKFFSFVTRQV